MSPAPHSKSFIFGVVFLALLGSVAVAALNELLVAPEGAWSYTGSTPS